MRTSILIERLQRKWFPSTDDKAWKQWVNYKKREPGELRQLLNSDIRDSLKRRVIFLLIVPSAEFNSIYWTNEVGNFNERPDFLKTLNPDLLSYATDLIVEFHNILKPIHCDKPENYAQGGGGITVFFSVPDKYHDALYFYNNCILLLLTMPPTEQCEKVFPLFSLLDISTYSGMEDCSGYNPFQNLLYSNVDEKWKRQADASMRQIIIDELAGNTKPREKWENALRCYADIIGLQLYDKAQLHYPVDLFADQIQFLVSEKYYGEKLISDWHVVTIFQILSADSYKEIRYRVAKFVVFGNKNEFSVWSEESLQGANMILNEFGKDDEKLAEKIQSAIEDNKKKSIECKNQQANIKNAEDKIINQMK